MHRWTKSLTSQARGDLVLTYRAVSLVLALHVYIARAMHGDKEILDRLRGRWEPLVDDGTYQRIRDYVERHQRLPRQATQRYLLIGLLRYPLCGMRMAGSSRSGHGPRYRCNATDYGVNSTAGECR